MNQHPTEHQRRRMLCAKNRVEKMKIKKTRENNKF